MEPTPMSQPKPGSTHGATNVDHSLEDKGRRARDPQRPHLRRGQTGMTRPERHRSSRRET
jgi:hypothetical protein